MTVRQMTVRQTNRQTEREIDQTIMDIKAVRQMDRRTDYLADDRAEL